MRDTAQLQRTLFAEREAAFYRLKGGFPIPLAGTVYWALLGTLGCRIPATPAWQHLWIFVAFCTSGLMFPLAFLSAKLFGNKFLQDSTAITDVLFPAFASMFLFWPIAISAYWTFPQLVPLILAVGMSIHWPVIGWMYGRTALYTAHAFVRAILCFVLWNWFPSTRFTLLPFAVSLVYLATVFAIFIAARRPPARLPAATVA